jgi:isocitrate dehydrogenase
MLKESLPVLDGEIVDSTKMNVAALDEFVKEQIAAAKETGVLFSVHLKATMMKVSDPILFGKVIEAFFPAVFAEYGDAWPRRG